MGKRNTKTGINYEEEVRRLLENYSNHKVAKTTNKRGVYVGKKRNGGKHYVDILLNGDELLSLKYQEVQGTAEEKIPFEIMKLQQMVVDGGYKSATIVLAGADDAWYWKDYYLSEEFREHMKHIYPNVSVISHQEFVNTYLNVKEGESVSPQGLDGWLFDIEGKE